MRGRACFLVVGLATASGLLFSGASFAADEKKPEPSVSQLSKGPSLRQTGRVGATNVETGGVGIEQRSAAPVPAENSVEKAVTADEETEDSAHKPPPAGVIDQVKLEQEVLARFSEARTCRVDVARRKQIAPAKVAAKTLQLRWTILPSGAVNATQVVATTTTDPEIMTCMKGRMASWTFTRPTGGSVAMDRPFTFR